MEAIKVSRGKKFIQKGERMKYLFVLLQGNVRASYKTDAWDLEPGSIIGMPECNSEVYLCDYVAMSDCMMYAYEYTKPADFEKIFQQDRKYVSVFVMAAMHQTAFFMKRYENYYHRAQSYYTFLMKMYQGYGRFCDAYSLPKHSFQRIGIAKPFVSKEHIDACMSDFYKKMSGMSLKNVDDFLKRDIRLGVGEILNGTGWMQRALNLMEEIREHLQQQKELLMSANEDNLYQRYIDLLMKAAAKGLDIGPLQENLSQMIGFAKDSQLYEEEFLDTILRKYESYNFGEDGISEEDLQEDDQEEDDFSGDYLTQILNYAEYEKEKADIFRVNVDKLRNLADVYSTEDHVRVLRRRLTESFFEIYKLVFKKSLSRKRIPTSIKMFLNFGFVDQELAGENTTKSLKDMVEKLFLCKADNVYTIYEWLCSIYRGANEPSRNQFDLDYPGYLNEEKKSGRISVAEQKELLQDQWKKVEFEIDNMLASNSKMTYGKLSSYCPLLCEYDVINSMENMLVTAEKINESLDYIRSVDFSLFYRKVVFSDPDRDINMEMIEKEVLPNIILMPNTGNRAMMWQETAGIRKDTPARFMFPILSLSNIQDMMIETAGRYRWEICRKIQGVRWNDITDPSLTSEYTDYIQYYRKNHELSPEAKEKIKNALYKSKNNFREVFVKDYQGWINYEAKGSFRLNKVAREMLFKYCPLASSIRQSLKINPMFQEMFNRYDIITERSIRRLDNLYERYQKKGGEITRELQDNRDFYDL